MTAVLFDLDGTLTDPKLGLVNCVKYALDHLGRPCPEAHDLTAFIGPPLRPMFASLLATTDKDLIEKAVALYRERYADLGVYETQAYEGIQTMLEESGNIATAAFVATSKPTVFARRILKSLGLDGYFAGIHGTELDGTFDNKADLVRHLLMVERIPNDSAIMVGDRAVDIAAAKANGLRSVGTLWGYGSADELDAAGADRLCAIPGELPRCLAHW